MLTFMFFVNMLGAIILLPALAAWLVKPKSPTDRRDEGAADEDHVGDDTRRHSDAGDELLTDADD